MFTEAVREFQCEVSVSETFNTYQMFCNRNVKRRTVTNSDANYSTFISNMTVLN